MTINTFLHNRQRLVSLHKKQKSVAIVAALVGGSLALQKYSAHFDKVSKNNSKLTGQAWLDELLRGHAKRFYSNMGMHKSVFRSLVRELRDRAGLCDTRYVSAEEQLAIFLYLSVTGVAQCHLEERFQRSPDTLTK